MLGSSSSSRQVNRQGQKSVQMFPGNQIFLCVESSNSSQLLLKVAHYICGDVSRQKIFSERQIFKLTK